MFNFDVLEVYGNNKAHKNIGEAINEKTDTLRIGELFYKSLKRFYNLPKLNLENPNFVIIELKTYYLEPIINDFLMGIL